MPTIFEKIIKGEISCYKITEDQKYFAFLDNKPKSLGHVLVVPKKPVVWVWELDKMGEIFQFCQPIIKAQLQAFSPKMVSVKTWGLEVPHAHIHLLPVYKTEEYSWENPQLTPEKFQEVANKLISCLSDIRTKTPTKTSSY